MTKAEKKPVKTPGIDVRESSVRLQFTDGSGTRHRITLKDAGGAPLPPTVANVRAAERTMTDIKAAIRLGTFDLVQFFPELAPKTEAPAKSVPTLGEQLDTWYAGLRVRKSTLKGYTAALNFWKIAPADEAGLQVATVKIDELVFSQCRHALNVGASRHRRGKVDPEKPPKPLSAKTVNNYLACLRAALDLAVDDGLIAKNPAGEGSKLRAKVRREPPDPLDLPELLAVVQKISEKAPAAGDYVDFWGNTGLRTSELNALEWRDVDLRKGEIYITQSLIAGEQEDDTKTGYRAVRLNSRARAAIERQRVRTQLAGGVVWLNPFDEKPWDGYRDFLRSYWAPALRSLGIRYRRPYNLRHTYATMLLHAGVNAGLAAEQLGHSAQMFHTRYARWIHAARTENELSKLDAMLAAHSATPPGAVSHI